MENAVISDNPEFPVFRRKANRKVAVNMTKLADFRRRRTTEAGATGFSEKIRHVAGTSRLAGSPQ